MSEDRDTTAVSEVREEDQDIREDMAEEATDLADITMTGTEESSSESSDRTFLPNPENWTEGVCRPASASGPRSDST